MSYLGLIFPILILEFWFQQWTLLYAEEREGGWKTIYCKDWSFSQQLISSVLRDSSLFRPVLSHFSRSKSPLMRRELRFLGSNPSTGNDSTFLHSPSISKRQRLASPCNPHSFPEMSLLQEVILSKQSFEGKTCFESGSSSGQSFINIAVRCSRVPNWSGSFSRLLQLEYQMDFKLGVGNPPVGKYSSLGQSLISKASRCEFCLNFFWHRVSAVLHNPK